MQLVQRRMKIRTVEALVVVQDDQLPVRLHVVDDAPAETEVGDLPRREAFRQIQELRAQSGPPNLPRLNVPHLLYRPHLPQQDEDVPVPHVAAGPVQRVVVPAEIRRHVRRCEEASLETVRPVVIRALDAIGEMPLGLLAQPRAAMTADVEQRVNRARPVARDDDALVAERAREVVAGVRNLIGAPGADPAVEIEPLELGAIKVRIGVEAPGEGGVHRRSLG